MAYQGYLIKVGDYTIPLKYIKADSYSVSDNSQDLEPYRDSNGVLHRNVVDNSILKIEFNTVPMMTDEEVRTLLGNIKRQYTNEKEKKCSVTAFSPESGDYVTRDCYMVDLEITPYWADKTMIQYNPFRIAFIGY